MAEPKQPTTVGEFRRMIAAYPDDWNLVFESRFSVSRVKQRGPNMVNVEFFQSIISDGEGKYTIEEDPADRE